MDWKLVLVIVGILAAGIWEAAQDELLEALVQMLKRIRDWGD